MNRRLVFNAVADTLLPGNEHWPSAGSLDLGPKADELAALVVGHAVALDALLGSLPDDFASFDAKSRNETLRRIEVETPDLFAVGRVLVFDAYYRHGAVLRVLAIRAGYRGGAPQPDGFALERFDLAALTRIRTMLPRWRPDGSANADRALIAQEVGDA